MESTLQLTKNQDMPNQDCSCCGKYPLLDFQWFIFGEYVYSLLACVFLLTDDAGVDLPLMLGCTNMMRLIKHTLDRTSKQCLHTARRLNTRYQWGCATLPTTLIQPWQMDGDIVLSFATGFLMRPVPIHNGMMWIDMLNAGIGGVGAPTIGHIVSPSMLSLILFVAYTNAMRVNTYMSQVMCHSICTYKYSMHISPLYSMNDTVSIIEFGPLFCIGGPLGILFISS